MVLYQPDRKHLLQSENTCCAIKSLISYQSVRSMLASCQSQGNLSNESRNKYVPLMKLRNFCRFTAYETPSALSTSHKPLIASSVRQILCRRQLMKDNVSINAPILAEILMHIHTTLPVRITCHVRGYNQSLIKKKGTYKGKCHMKHENIFKIFLQ